MERRTRLRRKRRGNTASTIGLSLVVLLGFAALAIDFGYARSADAQAQSVTDAAAHAALQSLDGTLDGVDLARIAAQEVAAANLVDGEPVDLDLNLDNDADGDIVVGIWDPDTASFSVFDEESDDVREVNAIQVLGRVANIDTFFLPVIDSRAVSVSARSTVALPDRGGAGAVDCFLPLALPKCLFDTKTADEILFTDLVLNPAGVDNAGWVGVGEHPSAAYAKEIIGDCEAAGPARIGDAVQLDNGVKTSAMSAMADAIGASDTMWRDDDWGPQPAQWSASALAAYGTTLERPLVVFEPDSGNDYCSGAGGPWNESGKIVGFAWGVVYDVRTKGGAADKNFRLRIDLSEDYDVGTDGGGLDLGVMYSETTTFVE